MEIQWALGADIAMAFDHLAPGQSSREQTLDAMQRTLRWLQRSRHRHDELAAASPGRQTMWPIVQGGTDAGLRRASLAGILAQGAWTGVAIGGLSVGESKTAMHAVLEQLAPDLPRERPRYLMGVGFPDRTGLEGTARGGPDLTQWLRPANAAPW